MLTVWVDGVVLRLQQLDGVNTAGGWNSDGSAAAGGVVEVRLLALLLVLSSRRLLELPKRPVLASGGKENTQSDWGARDNRYPNGEYL
jgi:hypothetical protein